VFKEEDELFSYPLIATPIVTWMNQEDVDEIKTWKEAYIAAMLINRYADIMVMHTTQGWVHLPNTILRENLYTDPRKPVAVESGLKVFGEPDEKSPVFVTTNFALTYYTVAADIEAAKIDCYLIVIDTEGISVESSVAGRQLTADKIAEAFKESKVEERVKHKKLIIPGRAARLKGETEEIIGWDILVGPIDSSGIPKYVQNEWSKVN
jgi:acetyl-CoA decarbonylase/synthase complex subunit gamma